jgi:type I restriction enzyme S subunit
MKHKPYPKYKDSGVEWIGKMPEGWGVRKLSHISRLYSGGTPDKTKEEYWEDGEVPWIASGEVNQVDVTHPTTYISKEGFHNSSAKWMPEGALIMALAGQGKTKGMVAYLRIRTTGNQSLAAIVPEKIHGRYLFYWLRSNYFNMRGLTGEGIRDGLDLDILKEIKSPLPSREEQQSIAAFLDKKTAEIDALIDRDRRLIGLLREKRSSLINHAVTKGLDPKAELKDSGVEWIGEIPEGWDLHKLKFVDSVIMGQSPDSEDYNYDQKGLPFLQGNAEFGEIHPSPQIWCETANKKAIEKDILLSVRAPIGAVNIADQKYGIGRGLCAIRSKKSNYKFLYYQFLSRNEELNSIGTGSTYTAISTDEVGNFVIINPPEKEQLSIASFLDKQIARIDSTVSKIETKIILLEEYKKSLIHNTVTGKINVVNS